MADYLGNRDGYSFCLADFQEKFRTFGTLKKLTCFFESANFLMTKYHLVDDDIGAVFENDQGDTLQFRGLLCGYGGNGSTSTAEVLIWLGIPEELAFQCCCRPEHKGFQMKFSYSEKSNNYSVEEVQYQNWFSSSEDLPLCRLIYLGDGVSYSVLKHTIVFHSFDNNTLLNVLRCLQLMEPFSFEYSLDADAPIRTERELTDAGLLNRNVSDCHGGCDANLFIRGERFSIYCCIPGNALLGTLNTLYFSLSGKDLFCENRFGRLAFYQGTTIKKPTFWNILKSLYSKAPEKKQYRLPIGHSAQQ